MCKIAAEFPEWSGDLADPKIIVALDFSVEASCLALVDALSPEQCRLKIGKEMFTRFGPALVATVQDRGFDVFLDLKFHDIPNTVNKAVASACDLGVWMVNVHASGGARMMAAAKEAVNAGNYNTHLIAVTVLTSMDANDLAVMGIDRSPAQQVDLLAKLSADSGFDGVVCSAQEAGSIKSLCGKDFLCVTPGIRPEGNDSGDQRRVMTPVKALENGSDYLVIGRPITQASEPAQALLAITRSINNARLNP